MFFLHKAGISWHFLASTAVFGRIFHYRRASAAQDFVCSGDDGLAPAGMITWTRYQVLLSRIQAVGSKSSRLTCVLEVNQLDQKLLWAELDEDQSGVVGFDIFCHTAACLQDVFQAEIGAASHS